MLKQSYELELGNRTNIRHNSKPFYLGTSGDNYVKWESFSAEEFDLFQVPTKNSVIIPYEEDGKKAFLLIHGSNLERVEEVTRKLLRKLTE